ncbi:hypothetical protein Bca101_059281 [Brassica carinata]
MFHSRRSFVPTNSMLEAGLWTIKWVLEALHDLWIRRVILEISSQVIWEALSTPWLYPNLSLEISKLLRLMHNFDHCQSLLVPTLVNVTAEDIAVSVTKDRLYQSYIARGGPCWLAHTIRFQSVGTVSGKGIYSLKTR